MSVPTELSFDEILKYMLEHDGKVTNHELVKHFKVFLTNPDMRDEARNTFKKHVNTLAMIKTQNNEKWLILKKKYMPNKDTETIEGNDNLLDSPIVTSPDVSKGTEASLIQPEDTIGQNSNKQVESQNALHAHTEISPVASELSLVLSEEIPPKVFPRRKSSEKSDSEKLSTGSNILRHKEHGAVPPNQDIAPNEAMAPLSTSRSDSMLVDNDQKISVKERKQMFNRMASEGDVLKSHQIGGNFNPQANVAEERSSLIDSKIEAAPLDSKQKQWILYAARGDYNALAKICKENPKLVRTKDPFTGYTAMHWACKRGDEGLVKMLAGVSRLIINERSNGGYTPLHIAVQFRHERIYRLLIDVYDADANVRDWAGKKPRQYLTHTDTSLATGFRKKESFLRIGSLNVRVKKTTEAFSNFLGVGATRSSAYIPKSRDMDRQSENGDQLHKNWGSADNIQKETNAMGPPLSNKVRRRGASGRRGVATHSRSTPSTPDQPRAQIDGQEQEGDSDSDCAAGFHAAWRR